MKKIFSLLCLTAVITCFAQDPFITVPLSEALIKADTEGKFILLQFEAVDCNQCNEVANKGFGNKEVAAKMEQRFICLKIDADYPERNKIASAYNLTPNKSFGTLFLDGNGTLIHSFLRTTSFYKELLSQMTAALDKAGEVLNIGELEKEYKNGNRSFGFLEILLRKRKVVQLPTDALLDEYINALPTDSLAQLNTLRFIAEMAPMLDSKADKVLRANQASFNRAWYSMSLPLRISINNRIIYKGMEKAIREKDEKFALRTASFAQGTNTNPASGTKAYDINMLRYYDEVKDTTAYFRKAIAYYERYFLSVSPDSIKRNDSINMKRMMGTAKKDTVREGNRMTISSTVAFAPYAQRFSSELNNGAYAFYLRTDNPYLLSIATEWVERALEFFESPQAWDTYAKLLYKQGRRDAATVEITKAIALQQKRGYPTKAYEATLTKMKNNVKLTD